QAGQDDLGVLLQTGQDGGHAGGGRLDEPIDLCQRLATATLRAPSLLLLQLFLPLVGNAPLSRRGPAQPQQQHAGKGASAEDGSSRRPAAGPLDRSLDEAGRAGGDGFVVLPAAEVVGQVGGAGVALGGVLVQTLQGDRLEVARQPVYERA